MTEGKEYWRWPESKWVSQDIDWESAGIISAGVDIGSVSSQAVIMCDSELYAYSNIRSGSDSADCARKAMARALEGTRMKVEDIHYIVGTGYGRGNVPFAHRRVNEIVCHALGANYMYGPGIKTVLDLGGQDCKAIKCDERGKMLTFLMNDKCAADIGRGMEVLADLLQVPIQEVGELSLAIKEEPEPVSQTCAVYAKTQATGLLRIGWAKNEVLAAYCSAMAQRIMTQVGQLDIEKEVAITGGIAKNIGVVRRLEKGLGFKVLTSRFDPQIAGALGAALAGKTLGDESRKVAKRKA